MTSLNVFLQHCNLDPVGSVLSRPWDTLTKKTQSHYTKKASEIIAEILRVVSPESAAPLWHAVKSIDESYKEAAKPLTKRQLLSLVVDKVTFPELVKYIPDLKRHQYTAARKHVCDVGAGQPADRPQQLRTSVDMTKVEHFIDFITASNIIQDLPFGRKTLKLSNNEEIEIPHVIRTLMPSRLIAQYTEYCKESSYEPLSRSTLFKILSESCVASVRKSLQGLDNYAAEGGRAFDDLSRLMDTLLNYGASESAVRDIKEQLKRIKQYLKGDYKVYACETFRYFFKDYRKTTLQCASHVTVLSLS